MRSFYLVFTHPKYCDLMVLLADFEYKESALAFAENRLRNGGLIGLTEDYRPIHGNPNIILKDVVMVGSGHHSELLYQLMARDLDGNLPNTSSQSDDENPIPF